MRILALDISSVSTGWAVLENGKLVKQAYGTITMKQKLHGERLIYFEEQVSKLIEKYEPTHFFIEEIWKGPSPKTFKILAFYHGAAHKVCFKYFQKGPQVLGASATRKLIGNKYDVNLLPSKKERLIKKASSKQLTFEFIKKKFRLRSFTFNKSNDITDAIALALGAHLSIGAYHEKSAQSSRRKSGRK